MKTGEFRSWLKGRNVTDSAVSTRLHSLKKIEQSLGEMGISRASLDAAYDHDGLAQVRDALLDIRQDAKGGGQRYRVLMRLSENPLKRLSNFARWLGHYRQFRAEQENALPRSDWSELERLRDQFLDRASDFVSFADQRGTYFETEREYKDQMIDRVASLSESELDGISLGQEIFATLTPKSGPLLRWEAANGINKKNPELAPEFYQALATLARGSAPIIDAVAEAAATLQDLRTRGARVLTLGEILSIVITVAGIARPTEAAPFKIEKGRELAKRLRGKPLFAGKEFDREQVIAWLELLQRIFVVMRDIWNWQPRDLVDVQGFAWIALDKSWDASNEEVEESESQPDTLSHAADSKMPNPTNMILYGPPGTGKTFATAEEAVRLCDGQVPPSREETMARYNTLVDAQQVRFVTFHQSYSYEDFVEGLRPTTSPIDDDSSPSAGFRLEPRKGIFREICALAEQARKHGGKTKPFDLTGRQIFKMSLGRAGLQDHIYEAAIEGSYVALGWGGEEDWSDPVYGDYQAIYKRWNEIEPGTSGNSGNIAQVWRFRASMQAGDIVIVSEGNSRFRAIGEIIGPYRYAPTDVREYNHRRDVRWLLVLDESLPAETIYSKAFTQQSCYKLGDQYIKKEALARLLSGSTGPGAKLDQFVLIIDEINRANISKVFGELITLIEPDKRLGMRNGLSVTLPYSGDQFGVPANLHIIGTMNTADRSIALLDTALRRRFIFRELMPQPHLLLKASVKTGVDLESLLTAINDRIEYLFDREHQIGHAYFLGCESRADVDLVMRHKVIPLLAEYFFDDWAKVAAVLGDADGAGRFLDRVALKAPVGLGDDEDGAASWRWTVRPEFTENAYAVFA